MSNVIIVANKVILKEIVDREFLETVIFLRIICSERPSLLNYVESMAKADIKLVGSRIFSLLLEVQIARTVWSAS